MAWVLIPLLWLLLFLLTWMLFRRERLRTPWHLDVAALGLLGLMGLGFFWRVVIGQGWLPADGGDLVSFLFPTYRFAASLLHSGYWPLWNPYLYGGVPHIGDIQAGFLYPPNLLLFLFNPHFSYATMQWLSIGHIWFAGAGLYLLLVRGLRISRVPALAGAVAFMFADPFLVHFGNLNLNAVASWLPWIFWAYLVALKNGNLRWGAVTGVLLAAATLAGHIQTTLFIILALATYAAIWLWLRREEPGGGRRALYTSLSWLLCVLLTVVLTAPVLLPALQLSRYTARVAWNYQEAAGYSFSPAQWIGWLIPGFFGRGPQFYWGAWPRAEIGYVGVFPLILAGLALALRRDRETWSWAGLAGVSFVVALGIYAILHGWLTLVPGFGQFRAPARMLVVTDFSLAILAALGLEAVLRPFDEREGTVFRRAWRWVAYGTAAVLAIAVPLIYLTLLLVQDRAQTLIVRTTIALDAVMAFIGLLAASLLWLTARRGEWAKSQTLAWLAVALILLDLASLGSYVDLGNDNPSARFEQEVIASYLKSQPGPCRIDTRTDIDQLWQPDTALFYGLEDVNGVANPSILADVTRYWDGLGSRSSRLYDLLNTCYVIARKDAPLDWDKFSLAFDGDPNLNVYVNRRVLPGAFAVGQIQAAPDHETAWAAIHAPDFDPSASAVVEGSAPKAGGTGEVSEIRSEPGRVSMRATAHGPVLLVVSQLWYPGWQVWVDGASKGAPLRTNYLFQGVPLDEGTHQVELRFVSQPWRWGWVLAGITAVGLFVWAAATVVRRSRSKPPIDDGR